MGQMMDEFQRMTWYQQDSVIAMLYSAGMSSVSDLMIEKAYSSEKEQPSPRAQAMAKFANWKGVKSLSSQDYQSSLDYFTEALSWYEKDPQATSFDIRTSILNQAEAQEAMRDTASLSSFDQALQMMEANNTGEDSEYLSLLQRTARNRLVFERFDEAEELAKESVRIAKSVFTQRSDEYLNAFMSLGRSMNHPVNFGKVGI